MKESKKCKCGGDLQYKGTNKIIHFRPDYEVETVDTYKCVKCGIIKK